MNMAHLHILINHIPVLGIVFGLFIYLYGFIRKSQDILQAGLLFLVVIALLTIPTFLTGDPAADIVRHLPDTPRDLIRNHDDSAGYALTSMLILGVIALFGLYKFRKGKNIPRGFSILILALSLFVSSIMARTAYLGGLIRHSEIRSDTTVTTTAQDTTRVNK